MSIQIGNRYSVPLYATESDLPVGAALGTLAYVADIGALFQVISTGWNRIVPPNVLSVSDIGVANGVAGLDSQSKLTPGIGMTARTLPTPSQVDNWINISNISDNNLNTYATVYTNTNTPQVLKFDFLNTNFRIVGGIYKVNAGGGGGVNLSIEVSTDDINYLLLETVNAGASSSTKETYNAIGFFRYLRITHIGAAGVNTNSYIYEMINISD